MFLFLGWRKLQIVFSGHVDKKCFTDKYAKQSSSFRKMSLEKKKEDLTNYAYNLITSTFVAICMRIKTFPGCHIKIHFSNFSREFTIMFYIYHL